ncbi:MAG: hypothetical protein Q4E74_04710 [Ruminococcus sp.]|nr:hypothetical protein [Ruminococcus sp.]
MGSEILLKKIKSDGTKQIIGGIIIMLLGTLFTIIAAFDDEDDVAIVWIFAAVLLALGIILAVFGIKNRSHPENAKVIRKNPALLNMADELFADIIYEDKFVKISNRIIANQKDITQMTYTNEIFLMYISKESYNFVPTGKELILETARGRLALNIYGRTKNTVNELANMICRLSPNTRVGYTNENLQYLAQMRQSYSEYLNRVNSENMQ